MAFVIFPGDFLGEVVTAFEDALEALFLTRFVGHFADLQAVLVERSCAVAHTCLPLFHALRRAVFGVVLDIAAGQVTSQADAALDEAVIMKLGAHDAFAIFHALLGEEFASITEEGAFAKVGDDLGHLASLFIEVGALHNLGAVESFAGLQTACFAEDGDRLAILGVLRFLANASADEVVDLFYQPALFEEGGFSDFIAMGEGGHAFAMAFAL